LGSDRENNGKKKKDDGGQRGTRKVGPDKQDAKQVNYLMNHWRSS